MMTGHIMPVNSIIIKLIKNSNAVFAGTSLLSFPVIGLRLPYSAVFGPIVLISLGRGSQLLQNSGPKPAINGQRLEISPVAALEVAQAAGSPNVFNLLSGM